MKIDLVKARLCASSCLIAASLVASSAYAQDAAKPATAADSASEEDGGAIVVTGSRIRLPNLINVEPTVSVSQQYLQDRGLTNVADALNEIPGYRGSVTPAGAQGSFGQGVNFINSYGLGSNRSLTLLNGRRVVSSNVTTIFGNASPGTQVDLNIIPVILVDRIDRVSIGGAPVYGTDAIAGTVNIIMKRKFEGLETRGTVGLTSRGDNFRYNLTGAGGFNFADGRGNLTLAVSYDKVRGLLGNTRDFYRANLGNTSNPCTAVLAGVCTTTNLITNLGTPNRTPQTDGRVNVNIGFNNSLTDGFPGSVLIKDLSIPGVSRGGVLSSGASAYTYGFALDGSLVPYNRGTLFVAAIPGPSAASARASGGDGFRFNDFIQLTSDIERINTNLFFNYDLTDNIRFFAEGMFFQGKGDELVQQPTWNSPLFGGTSGALTFRVDNPFLSAQAQQQLAALGYTTTFQMSRAHADMADLTGSSRNRLYRGVLGLEGDLTIGGRDFNWEVSGNYGRNNFTDFGQNINQQNFVNAVNVARVNGQIVCSVTPTVTGFPAGTAPIADPSCVPLNLFGEGAPSAAALNYVLANTVTRTSLEQMVVNVNAGGSPFDLFGNPVAFNVGYEHHEEKGAFNPDPFLAQGLGRSVAISPTSGKYNLDEVFGEVLVPVFTPNNDFIFSKLETFGRVRHVDNTVNGGFTAWAAGGSFAPIKDIEFRGNFTRSFRAPAIVELFSPRTNIFTSVTDICSPANINAGPVPAIRKANCDAFLAKYPTATPLAAAGATVPGVSGGNPALLNEVADSFTYGAIIRPRMVPGLAITVDYIDVKIKQPISNLSAGTITSACFDNATFNKADPANGNVFCSYIKRDAAGQVISDAANPGVITGFVNGNQIRMKGIQSTIDYSTKLDGIGINGTLEVSGDMFYLKYRLNDITGVAPVRSDGLLGDPKWQGQLRLRYFNDTWGLSGNVNYVGKQLSSVTNRGPNPNDTREFDHYKPYATVDGSFFVDPMKDVRLIFSVTNLFDRVGQNYYGYIVPASISDALGRRFALTVRKKY